MKQIFSASTNQEGNVKTIYTTHLAKFHGGKLLYRGQSLAHAIRIARRHDCTADGHCVAGPEITREDTGERLAGWHAAKPFCSSNEQFWY